MHGGFSWREKTKDRSAHSIARGRGFNNAVNAFYRARHSRETASGTYYSARNTSHARYAVGSKSATANTTQRHIGRRALGVGSAVSNSAAAGMVRARAVTTGAGSRAASTLGGAAVEVFGTSIGCRHALQITVMPISKSGDVWIVWHDGQT
jgi:hypothetical protein